MSEAGVNYRFLSVIGEGGFGRVYRARMETADGFHRDVAIKVLTDPDPPKQLLQRFRDEARILALVRDRAFVGVQPPITIGGRWAVVMEFVDGVSAGAMIHTGAMPPGVAPGTIIGGMDASAINEAQRLMSEYITAHGLGNRMLVVHQFTPGMIRNKSELAWYPGVDLVIDMDGFGGQGIKLAHYDQFVAQDGAPHGGLKLFYDEDVNLLSPAQVAALSPQPDLVIFQ